MVNDIRSVRRVHGVQRRLVSVLADIAENVTALMKAIQNPAIDDRAPKEEPVTVVAENDAD